MSERNLKADLEALGSNADEVAATLERMGIKGLRKRLCACPVARYLAHVGWRIPEVQYERTITAENQCIPTPPAISEFLEAFDVDLRYPQLVG